MKWFHGNTAPEHNCAASLGYRLDCPGAATHVACLRADPVYQQLDINQAVLADRSVLALQADEAAAIVDDLNRHFAQDGVRFQCATGDRWYCLLPRALQVTTIPPGSATGRNVSLTMTKGRDAGVWRGWLSEIEMLLYAHPVNQQRAAQGLPAVNSLWLWGEGSANQVSLSKPGATVFTDHFYTRSVADYLACHCQPLEAFSASRLGHNTLIVDDRLTAALATGDAAGYESLLQHYESAIFQPLASAGQTSAPLTLQLWGGGENLLTWQPVSSAPGWFSRLLNRLTGS